MADHFSQQALRVAIAQLCQSVGWHAIQTSSSDVLVEILERYLLNVGKKTALYCNHANRTQPNMIDVFHAFEEVGVSLRELLDYFQEMEVDAQYDPAVPSFPVHRAQSHVHSGLGARILRKLVGGTGMRPPPSGKKEGGSAGEGDLEDLEEEEEEEEEVWEEIPGYLPPLPKAKEEIGGDNGDDVESGIHISEGEPSPVVLKSPLGQSGLPALFRQRSQSVSEEDGPSRGSSISDEMATTVQSKTTVLIPKSDIVQDSDPALLLDHLTDSRPCAGVGTAQTATQSRRSPSPMPMQVDAHLATQESKLVASSEVPLATKPVTQHVPKPKPNLRINTGVGVASFPSVTTPTKDDAGITRQGSPCDQPRLPTLHRISPMGTGKCSSPFYPPHTPTLSPLLGTSSPTSPQVAVPTTRPVLRPLVGSPAAAGGLAGKHPARMPVPSSPVATGPPPVVSNVERNASTSVSSLSSKKTGVPPDLPGPTSGIDAIPSSSDPLDKRTDSPVAEAGGSPPRPSPPPLSSSSLSSLSPGELAPTSPKLGSPPSPSLSSLSSSPATKSPPSRFSPSPLSSSQPSPHPSPRRRSSSPSLSPEPYPSRSSPTVTAVPKLSSNSSLSSIDLSPSPLPTPSHPLGVSEPPAPGPSLHEENPAYPSHVANPLPALSPCSSTSSSASSSSSIASSSPAPSDTEVEPTVAKDDTFVPPPSSKTLAPPPSSRQPLWVTLPSSPQPPPPPHPQGDSLVLTCGPGRGRSLSPMAPRDLESYLSSLSSESSVSESSGPESPVETAFVKKKVRPQILKSPTTLSIRPQVPRLPTPEVPRPPPSQVPEPLHLTTSTHTPRLPSSKPAPRPSLPVVKAKKRRRSMTKKVRQPKRIKDKPLLGVVKKKTSPRLIVRIKKKLLKKEESEIADIAMPHDGHLATKPFSTHSGGNLKVAPVQTKRVSSIFPSAASRKQAIATAPAALDRSPPLSLIVSIPRSLLHARTSMGVSRGRDKGGMKLSALKATFEKTKLPPAIGVEGVAHGRGYKRELELSELGLAPSEPQLKKARLAPAQQHPPPPSRQLPPVTLARRPTTSSSSSSSGDSSDSSSDSEESVASPTPPAVPTPQVVLPFPLKVPPSLSSSSDNESLGSSRGKLKVTLTIPKRVPDHQPVKTEPLKPRRSSGRAPPAAPPQADKPPPRRTKVEQRSAPPSQLSLRSGQKHQSSKKNCKANVCFPAQAGPSPSHHCHRLVQLRHGPASHHRGPGDMHLPHLPRPRQRDAYDMLRLMRHLAPPGLCGIGYSAP